MWTACKRFRPTRYFDANDGSQGGGTGSGGATGNAGASQGSGAAGTGTGNAAQGGAKTWEPDDHAKAYAQREADRRVNEAIQKQKDDFARILSNKDADANQKLNDLKAAHDAAEQRAAEAQRKADFIADALREGVVDIHAAYAVARLEDLFDKKGNPDFAALKTAHPALFARPANTNAGNGAGSGGGGLSVNEKIRQAAGVA